MSKEPEDFLTADDIACFYENSAKALTDWSRPDTIDYFADVADIHLSLRRHLKFIYTRHPNPAQPLSRIMPALTAIDGFFKCQSYFHPDAFIAEAGRRPFLNLMHLHAVYLEKSLKKPPYFKNAFIAVLPVLVRRSQDSYDEFSPEALLTLFSFSKKFGVVSMFQSALKKNIKKGVRTPDLYAAYAQAHRFLRD